MHARFVCKAVRIAVAPLLMAGAMSAIGPAGASASACAAWTVVRPPDPGGTTRDNVLQGVVTLSSRAAWAAGYYFNGIAAQTLVERWNGSAWSQVPSQNIGGRANFNELNGVAATPTGSAWAVGYDFGGAANQTLIEQWNGALFRRVASPDPGGRSQNNVLTAVAATSGSNAWAVGTYLSRPANRTLIEHWNGHTWTQVPSPSPSSNNNALTGVAATSAGNAWAVGYYISRAGYQTLIEHWNGATWTRVASPSPSSNDNFLTGVAATSVRNAWAVGYYFSGSSYQTLTEHWNGATWTHVASPNASGSGGFNELTGAVAISPGDAWTAGWYFDGTADQTLVEHWNGSSWRRMATPDVGGSSALNALYAISASSAGDAWAVGRYNNRTAFQALALHCG